MTHTFLSEDFLPTGREREGGREGGEVYVNVKRHGKSETQEN
jgi:hypothetical protein